MTIEDALRTLGLTPEQVPAELRRAYLRLVKRHSPERDPEGFKRIREAYECLERSAQVVAPIQLREGEPPDGLELIGGLLERDEVDEAYRVAIAALRSLADATALYVDRDVVAELGLALSRRGSWERAQILMAGLQSIDESIPGGDPVFVGADA